MSLLSIMAGDRVIYVEENGTFDNDRHYMCMTLLPVKQT